MAEQSSHDVVNQSLSGGDPSPSDVPASTTDKQPARGDVGEDSFTKSVTTSTAHDEMEDSQQLEGTTGIGRMEEVAEGSSLHSHKPGPGPVESRALELNGVSSLSDFGDDSQGGSESDASRAESRNPTRTGSSKKAATFKPVSFAKFSVPKAPGIGVSAKLSDKAPLSSSSSPMGTPQPASRPRLVAKTTSSLRDSFSKPGASGMKPAGAAPDPNQVWNKNRPPQPTPSKHLTDEELKQQYGIHMTSRIKEDGGTTEAKWADIDDDEDDWAPETIEWTDGTKVTLTHTEATPAAADGSKSFQKSKSVSPPPEPKSTGEGMKIISKSTTSIGPNPTVLRLGANAERQARAAANVLLKGSVEKPPSASTSPAPVPLKSPWAPLPPIEKVSPVIPPTQIRNQLPPKTICREVQTAADVPDGLVAPQEIAADDFNRSWRESQSGVPRELYNSRSGRYEPVSEMRKGTWRNDPNFRPPAVLQRPTQIDSSMAAEPSPAFQTHRTAGLEGPYWGRHRTSSNVSGNNGNVGRRMSIGKPDKLAEPRRGSLVNGTTETLAALRNSLHPEEPPAEIISPSPQDFQARASTTATESEKGEPASAIQDAHPVTLSAPSEDAVAMQERIMKEKRLEARQRRLEQEAREEAERRERIRLKLEALGPPPEKPKLKNKDVVDGSRTELAASLPAAPAVQSPPKPPVPDPTGEPKQYGMMKVHHPDTVKRLVAANERSVEKISPTFHVRRSSSPIHDHKLDAAQVNGLRQPSDSPIQAYEKPPELKPDDKGPQWKGIGASTSFAPWSSSSKLGGTSTVPNPWKPLSNDKTLGNGVFDQPLGGFSGRDLPLRSLALEQPPAVSQNNTADRLSGSQHFTVVGRTQDRESMSPLPSSDAKHTPFDPLSPMSRPGPIGPPSLQHNQWSQPEAHRINGTEAWHNFHSVAANREAQENESLRHDMEAVRDMPSKLQVTFSETWKQVHTGDQAGQRQVIGITRNTDSLSVPATLLPTFDSSVSGLAFAETQPRPFGNVSVRGSRFFPQPLEQPKKMFSDEEIYSRCPSPPPPEDVSSHPVFMGYSNRPLVHLPAPKPIVKLPPNAIVPLPLPPTFAYMAAAPPLSRSGPQRPVSMATSWQEKINGLFGKKTTAEKGLALAVSSASKEPLDVQLLMSVVAVSLPQNVQGSGDGFLTTKQVEQEEEMFEDREAGSLPVVRVPAMAPPAAWLAAPPPSQSRLRSKSLKPMQVHSIEPYVFGSQEKDQAGNIWVAIRFPGSVLARTVSLPRTAGTDSLRTETWPNSKVRKGTFKAREGSANFGFKKTAFSQHSNGSASSPRHSPRNATWRTRPITSGSQ